jgi:hypothetical protein
MNKYSGLAASSSAWRHSFVGIVHNIADVCRKIKMENVVSLWSHRGFGG